MIHSRIAGTGSYLPAKTLTNADLERMVDVTLALVEAARNGA